MTNINAQNNGIKKLNWLTFLQHKKVNGAQKIAETEKQGKVVYIKDGKVVNEKEGAVKVDLTDGLNQEEAGALGIKLKQADQIAAKGWKLKGEAGFQTDDAAKVISTEELEQFDQAIRAFADATGFTFEESLQAYYDDKAIFGRQNCKTQAENRKLAEASLFQETQAAKDFLAGIKTTLKINDDNNPLLVNLKEFITTNKLDLATEAGRKKAIAYIMKNASGSEWSDTFQKGVLKFKVPHKKAYKGDMSLTSIKGWITEEKTTEPTVHQATAVREGNADSKDPGPIQAHSEPVAVREESAPPPPSPAETLQKKRKKPQPLPPEQRQGTDQQNPPQAGPIKLAGTQSKVATKPTLPAQGPGTEDSATTIDGLKLEPIVKEPPAKAPQAIEPTVTAADTAKLAREKAARADKAKQSLAAALKLVKELKAKKADKKIITPIDTAIRDLNDAIESGKGFEQRLLFLQTQVSFGQGVLENIAAREFKAAFDKRKAEVQQGPIRKARLIQQELKAKKAFREARRIATAIRQVNASFSDALNYKATEADKNLAALDQAVQAGQNKLEAIQEAAAQAAAKVETKKRKKLPGMDQALASALASIGGSLNLNPESFDGIQSTVPATTAPASRRGKDEHKSVGIGPLATSQPSRPIELGKLEKPSKIDFGRESTTNSTNQQMFTETAAKLQPKIQAVLDKYLPQKGEVTIEIAFLSNGARDDSLKCTGVEISVTAHSNVDAKKLAKIEAALKKIKIDGIKVDPKMFIFESAGAIKITQHRTRYAGRFTFKREAVTQKS